MGATRRIPKATYVPLVADIPSVGAAVQKFGFVRQLSPRPGEVDAIRKAGFATHDKLATTGHTGWDDQSLATRRELAHEARPAAIESKDDSHPLDDASIFLEGRRTFLSLRTNIAWSHSDQFVRITARSLVDRDQGHTRVHSVKNLKQTDCPQSSVVEHVRPQSGREQIYIPIS